MRTEQGCGADYLTALEKLTGGGPPAANAGNKTAALIAKTEDPIKKLELVRLQLARYLGRLFSAQRVQPVY